MSCRVNVCGLNTNTLPRMSSQETHELLKLAQSGNTSARERLVIGNMRLVLSLTQRFAGRKAHMDDLFQVGCIGLIKAIDNFNLALNVRFSTYAVPMILGEMRRALRDVNSLRVARSLRDVAYKALQAREKLEREEQKEITVDEIATELSLPLQEVVCALDAISEPLSLYDSVYHSDEDPVYLLDQIRDERETPERWIDHHCLTEALGTLNEREKNILNLRYFQGKTQVEISKEIGISQAQVSRLEKNALRSIESRIR